MIHARLTLDYQPANLLLGGKHTVFLKKILPDRESSQLTDRLINYPRLTDDYKTESSAMSGLLRGLL